MLLKGHGPAAPTFVGGGACSPTLATQANGLINNLTSETLDFHVIPGVVPNRGLNPQTDLSLYGLHYLQRVTDADPPPFSTAGQALDIEPGCS